MLSQGIDIWNNDAQFVPILGDSFTPADIDTLLWLDAKDIGTITESSGLVSQWDDKSGNGRHITQGMGAKQPLYTTGNSVCFDGVDDYLGNITPFMLANGEIDIYLVQTTRNVAPNNIYLAEGYTVDSRPSYVPARLINTEMGATVRNDAGGFQIDDELGINMIVDECTRSFWRDTGSQFSVRKNGGNESIPVAYTRIAPYTLDEFTLGAIRFGASEARHIKADIHELVICNNLSENDRRRMDAYLARRW